MGRETQGPTAARSSSEGFLAGWCWAGWLLVKPGTCLRLKGPIGVQEVRFVTRHSIKRGGLSLDPGQAPFIGLSPAGPTGFLSFNHCAVKGFPLSAFTSPGSSTWPKSLPYFSAALSHSSFHHQHISK